MITFKKLRHFNYGSGKNFKPLLKVNRNSILEYWELIYDSETHYATQPINTGRIMFKENRYPAHQMSDITGRWVVFHGGLCEYGATLKLSHEEFVNLFGDNPNNFWARQVQTRFNLSAIKKEASTPVAGVFLKGCFVTEISINEEHFGLEIELKADYIHTEYYDTPNDYENERYNQNKAPSHFSVPRR